MRGPHEQTERMPGLREQYRIGYILNTILSENACSQVRKLQKTLEQRFPGAIWSAQSGAAHITVADMLSPGADYARDKDILYGEVGQRYVEVLANILQDQPPITISFDRIEAYKSAIIIRRNDDGSLPRIREQFRERVALLPGTKVQQPPFIHSTICRFTKEIDLAAVKEAVAHQRISIEELVSELWIARETKLFMQTYDVMERFQLTGA